MIPSESHFFAAKLKCTVKVASPRPLIQLLISYVSRRFFLEFRQIVVINSFVRLRKDADPALHCDAAAATKYHFHNRCLAAEVTPFSSAVVRLGFVCLCQL